jgi:hypothetical protein
MLPNGLPLGFPPLAGIAGFALQFATLGFIGGAAFSVAFTAAEGRHRLDEMSLSRFALWGAVGGLLMWGVRTTVGWSLMGLLHDIGLPAFSWVYTIPGEVIVLLGAGCAAGSLAMARRADDQELLESAEQVATVGLTATEARELLLGFPRQEARDAVRVDAVADSLQ